MLEMKDRRAHCWQVWHPSRLMAVLGSAIFSYGEIQYESVALDVLIKSSTTGSDGDAKPCPGLSSLKELSSNASASLKQLHHKTHGTMKSTYQCLSCRLKSALPTIPRRTFQTSTLRPARRKSAYPSIKQSALESNEVRAKEIDQLAAHLRPYTEREKQLLAMRYTPEQMKVIEAGEEAISATDMIKQGRLRSDAFRPTYIDDFATLRPLVDKPARLAVDEASDQEKEKKIKKLKIPGVSYGNDEEDPHMLRLCQQTGMDKDEIRKIRVKNLVSHRVVNQTRMGKIQSLYYLTIAGNQDGMLGIGEGKAAEDEDGRRQAMMNAIRNMKPIARYEERTIYGDVEAKVGASIVQISARPPGTRSISYVNATILT